MAFLRSFLFFSLACASAVAQPTALFEAEGVSRGALSPHQTALLSHVEASPRTAAAGVVRLAPAALSAEAVEVALPGASPLLLHRIAPTGPTVAWVGQGADAATYGLFVEHDGMVTGTLRVGGTAYALHPLTGGLHALARVDEHALPHHPPGWDAFQAEARAQQEAEPVRPRARRGTPAGDGPAVVGVLVPYSAASAAAVADIEGMILLALEEANYTMAVSGVTHRFGLAHTYQTPDDGTGSMQTDLPAMRTAGNGFMEEVHLLRDTYGADLVMLIGEYSDYCGLAYLWALAPEWGFGITARSCALGSYVFAHELGHNMGAQHNAENGTNNYFAFGYGTREVAPGFTTVMAYNSAACPLGSCVRIPFWSTPDRTWDGIPIGDAATRDNVSVLNTTAPQIAGYFGTPEGAVASLSADSLVFTLPEGGSASASISLTNAGGLPLRWDAVAVTGGLGAGSTAPPAGSPTPGASGYTFAFSEWSGGPEYAFEDVSASGAAIPEDAFESACPQGPLGNGLAEVALPFPFPFYGETHTTARVGVNGFLTFDPTYSACSSIPPALDAPGGPDGYVAPLWMNLSLAGGGAVYTEDLGDGRFVVQWEVPRATETTPRVFQAVLHASGDVLFQYAAPGQLVANGFTLPSTIGVRPPGGAPGLEVARGVVARRMARAGGAVHVAPVVAWLTVGPEGGVLDPSGAESLVLVLDASGLGVGEHRAELRFRTTDPFAASLPLAVTLTVEGAVSVGEDAAPVALSLDGPFPNPFAGTATVAFSLPQPAAVRLTLTDVLGREVAVLAEGPRAAGAHTVPISSAGLASGVYLVRLEAGGSVAVRRGVVLR